MPKSFRSAIWASITALSLLFPELAHGACQLPQPRLLCAEYSQSKEVVIARLTREKELEDGHRYKFAVVQRLRGHISDSFMLWEENSSGRATFEWKTGQSYLLFLNYSTRDAAWTIDGCGNSGPEMERRKTIAETERLAGGNVEPMVTGLVTADSWSKGFAGVTITASNGKTSRRTISDSDGRFEFHLAPGTYSFRASKDGVKFKVGPLSYEGAENLPLNPGSCAQIHFESQ